MSLNDLIKLNVWGKDFINFIPEARIKNAHYTVLLNKL